ncbi:MAG: AAA family ATPase [Mogibacterium sp.]|nr:AAA family ATPase [Mogibacterium sp.]
MRNIFITGPEAAGEGFFGRTKELNALERWYSNAEGQNKLTLSIQGLNRIGKSSIVKKFIDDTLSKEKDTITVYISLDNFPNSISFWRILTRNLNKEIKKRPDIPNELADIIDEYYKQSSSTDVCTIRVNLSDFFKDFKKSSFRVILIIDEFDTAATIMSSDDFASLRSIANTNDNSVSLITVSRRSLAIISSDVQGTSTFTGIFDQMHIRPFKDSETKKMYDALADYDIFLDENEELKKKIEYYAGGNPYLLSHYLFSLADKAMVSGAESLSADSADEIRKEKSQLIRVYYETAAERLKSDGWLDTIYGTVVGPRISLDKNKVAELQNAGYLCYDEDSESWYCISRDFTEYLRYNCRPSIPLWYDIMHSEKIFREFVREVYPKLTEYKYTSSDDMAVKQPLRNEIHRTIYRTYNTRYLDWGNIEKFIESSNKYENGKDASACDVLQLGFTIEIIEKNWDKFKGYFGKNGSENLDYWQKYLDILKKVRNPLAHANPEYITEIEEKTASEACSLIAKLRPDIKPIKYEESDNESEDNTK